MGQDSECRSGGSEAALLVMACAQKQEFLLVSSHCRLKRSVLFVEGLSSSGPRETKGLKHKEGLEERVAGVINVSRRLIHVRQ